MNNAVLLSCCVLAVAGCGTRTTETIQAPDAADGVDADSGMAVARMYAHTRDTLYVVDDQNFNLEVVGDFGLPKEAGGVTDLAVTPDGVVYGITGSALYTVDPGNGSATLVATVSGEWNVGLTFLVDGSLLATDSAGGVRRIHPTTGVVEEIGAFGGGLTTAGDLVAIADGTMFAISDGGSGDADTNNWLITVDTTTGVGTKVGQISFGRVFGVAVANNRIYAFTEEGRIIEINPDNGVGTLRRTHPDIQFWGAGVTPNVAIID